MSEIQRVGETNDQIFSPVKFGEDMAITHILLVQNSRDRKLFKTFEALYNLWLKSLDQLSSLNEDDKKVALTSYAERIEESKRLTDESFWKKSEEIFSIQPISKAA